MIPAPMRRDLADLLLLLTAWSVMAWAVGLGGEFALNDDWSYAAAVQHLLEHGTFRPTQWTSMPLVTHAAWGALFCLPGGFSHVALRVSTLAAAGLGIVATYGLLGEVGASRTARLLGAFVVACNPLWVALSLTFMTDVPFTSFATLALWLYLRSLRTRSRGLAVAGTVVMLWATLNRQLGLFVAVAWLAGVLRRDPRSGRTLLRALLPLAVGIGALLAMQAWLVAHDAMPSEYTVKQRALLQALTKPGALAHDVAYGAFVAVNYLGLFLLPVLALARGDTSRAARILGIAVSLSLGGMLLATGKRMPLGFNVLSPSGIGPDLLRDVYVLWLPNRAPLPDAVWGLVTAMAVWGAGTVVARAFDALRGAFRDPSAAAPARAALLVGAGSYLTPILAQSFLDRYLLAVVPLLAALLTMPPSPNVSAAPHHATPWLRLPAVATLGTLLLLAVAGTHDWLDRARARTAALDWLQHEQGVPANRIDGGFEFHGATTYDSHYRPTPEHSWWWVAEDEYVVAMGPLPSYDVVREFAVDRWLPPRGDRVVVLHRSAPRRSVPVAAPR